MSIPGYEQFKQLLRVRLAKQWEHDTRNGHATGFERDSVLEQLRSLLAGLRQEAKKFALEPTEQERLLAEVAREIAGMGPLEPFLADPTVTEIMINGPTQICVERRGRLEQTGTQFRDAAHLMLVIERLLDQAGVSVTGSEPLIDASLPDGSRINVAIPPVVLNGPAVTIRKKARQWSMDDFIGEQSLTPQAAEFLSRCVSARANLVISGGTSTGKTTLVCVLSAFIPPQERIISIEKVAEFELINRQHWVRLVVRSSNMEGKGEVSLRTLVRNALSMRPDRIILGEARGGEALDVVQAMHTGHEGVITVLHANSPQAAMERLGTMMLMSGLELPPQACDIQIASAVDVIIHLARFADGTRRVASIAQVSGQTHGGFQIQELFAFDIQGFQPDGKLAGALRYTGIRPKCLEKFQMNNVEVPGWINRG